MPPGTNNDDSARVGLARNLLIISGCGIVVIAVTMLVGSAVAPKGDFVTTSQNVFSSLLPLFGTWVGTVTAYYFSKANFEAANQSVQNLVQMTVDQKLEKLKVAENMIQKQFITSVTIPTAGGEKTVTVPQLLEKLTPTITRVPILTEQGAVKYVLHQSLIYKFIAEVGMSTAKSASVPSTTGSAPPPPAGSTAQSFNINALNLEHLLAHGDMKRMATALATVSSDATVAAAKAAMDRVPQCQDVIVTAKGDLGEPMVGWLTNVEIGKLSKA